MSIYFLNIYFFNNPNLEYNDFAYKYIESRCPVLLVFFTDNRGRHVVPILGHTLNSDMWRPEAKTAYSPISRLDQYKPASSWVNVKSFYAVMFF